jgi:ATP-dependent RNA helicase RhlE
MKRRGLGSCLKVSHYMTSFTDLGLCEPLLRAVAAEGYDTPTPIQAGTIPVAMAGRDVLGLAQTGTGKTAAFALPIMHRLAADRRPIAPGAVRALILTPTRELALQIHEGFVTYGKHLPLRRNVVFGGVSLGPQIKALAAGSDVLVATPGRLLDLMNQGKVKLSAVEIFVLDEADRMLDMGFVRDVKKISAQVPKKRQTLLFSATMPEAVTSLATDLLNDFERVEVTPQATTAERIAQKVMFVGREDKKRLLIDLLADRGMSRAIVFTRTKHGANKVVEHLQKAGLRADAIHGNKSQNARQRALDDFKNGRIRALVATDIAARGIDIDAVSHVINFELPNEPESYVHRIGRTARAGAEGIALSFCEAEELSYLKAIEKTIRQKVPVETDHAYHATDIARMHEQGKAPPPPPMRGNGGGRSQSSRPQGQHSQGHRGQGAPAQKSSHGQPGQKSGQRPAARQDARPVEAGGRGQGDLAWLARGRGRAA